MVYSEIRLDRDSFSCEDRSVSKQCEKKMKYDELLLKALFVLNFYVDFFATYKKRLD